MALNLVITFKVAYLRPCSKMSVGPTYQLSVLVFGLFCDNYLQNEPNDLYIQVTIAIELYLDRFQCEQNPHTDKPTVGDSLFCFLNFLAMILDPIECMYVCISKLM